MMNYFHWKRNKSQCWQDLRRSCQARPLSQCGQALIEYLLMIAVTLILLVGLTLAFFNPLQSFLAKLNNTYIRCLLETGELPKTRSDSEGSCDAEIPQFQARNMDGSAQDPDKKNSELSENAKGESSAGGAGSELSGSSAGASTRKSSLIRNAMRTSGNARPEVSGSKATSVPIDSFNAGEGFTRGNSGAGFTSTSRKKSKKIDLSNLSDFERRKLEREKEKVRTIAVDSESFTQKRNKKIIVKPPETKSSDQDLDVKTDFGDYFKIFFFIVIVLFIIILMVSQAMQLTNSSDN